MELRARIRPHSRRAAWMAALVALIASVAAGAAAPSAFAKTKAKPPVITSISPKRVAIGQTLTIRGKHFRRGRGKNTVVLKRDGAKAVFVKADIGTKKLLMVKLPPQLTGFLFVREGSLVETPFRLRVLAKRLGRRFTSLANSPLVGPEQPPADDPGADAQGDCDGDGQLNGVDADDDNDLLADVTEQRLKIDQCAFDSDKDGVSDGYEFQSAVDLNDDEYQEAQSILPAPEKRPYPNPLYADGGVDYDGDSLTLGQEYALWKAFRNPAAGLSDLVYSDGNQYSAYGRSADGRRPGALVGADPNAKYSEFLAWADATGYGSVMIRGSLWALRDFNQDGAVAATATGNYRVSEERYFDFDGDGKLSDDERDEDADGLTNYDEASGRLTSGYWAGCYRRETAFPIVYAGTDLVDPDSDGDTVRDGADDQDHDDIPNVMEMSRNAASGRIVVAECNDASAGSDPSPTMGAVNPYNPCLPYVDSRTCTRHPSMDNLFAPFDPKVPYYQVLN